MNYQETIDYLYSQHPAFQKVGANAYKEGLDTSLALNALYNDPTSAYKCIHIGGTNGKGSVSHTLAAVLQCMGYKVGLYTSPHLIDFRERIRVNGEMISKDYVIDFVNDYISKEFNRQPSFFELTMIMAFDYFRNQNVDFAVIEVGLGGRLDSTNIITPIMSVVTNISFDHTQFLGNTLPLIASEKAGIFKNNVPAVVGEAKDEVKQVFVNKASTIGAPILFAEEHQEVLSADYNTHSVTYHTLNYDRIESQLSGACQIKNANTILNSINTLKQIGVNISDQAVAMGFKHVCDTTGLMGRWMKISDTPLTICDTGHNVGGIEYITKQLKSINCNQLHMVIGFVNDKDIEHILDMLPQNAQYYFTQAQIERAKDAHEVSNIASLKGLHGMCYKSVEDAFNAAKLNSMANDCIFIGGSTFIVADLLTLLSAQN